MERPSGGIPTLFTEHARMMFDLQVLAYQTDMTRVTTFLMSREVSPRPYPEIGVPDAHHLLTLLGKLGVAMDSLGDSTGRLTQLALG